MTNDRSELEEGRVLLHRSREEELTPAEEKRLGRLLAQHPELRAVQSELAETEALVAEAAPTSFAPFFSSRVMSRLERRREENRAFSEQLVFLFRRLAIAVLLVSASLAVYNTTTSPPWAKDSLVERVVGIPSPTLDEAYSLNLYDTP